MGGSDEERLDDPSIHSDDPLWRRIHPMQVVPDPKSGGFRPSSAAFNDPSNGTPMSVVLGKEVLAAACTSESVLQDHPGFSLASLTAGLARKHQQTVYRLPVAGEPAHAEVKGAKPKSTCKEFAKQATWVVLRQPAQS
jgi:hypothetical protein